MSLFRYLSVIVKLVINSCWQKLFRLSANSASRDIQLSTIMNINKPLSLFSKWQHLCMSLQRFIFNSLKSCCQYKQLHKFTWNQLSFLFQGALRSYLRCKLLVITPEHLCVPKRFTANLTAASLRPEKRGLGLALGVKQSDNACAQCKQVQLTPILSGKVSVAMLWGQVRMKD